MRSVDAARFSMIPRNDVPRSAFDVSHTHKTTFNAGLLIPVYVDEVLPGDSFRLNMTAFARLATPIVPVMDNLILESWFFFVANRLVWEHWERFMGEQDNPTDTTAFLVPGVVVSDVQSATLADYFGITVNNGIGKSLLVSALPFRAYALIWNEWFRDADIDTKLVVSVGDGPDTYNAVNVLARRRKRHDYFTSARPWPQKPAQMQEVLTLDGAIAPGGRMNLPVTAYNIYGAGAPVTGLGVADGDTPTAAAQGIHMSGNRKVSYNPHFASATDQFMMAATTGGDAPDVRVLISDIRTAMTIQQFMERNARGGTRYSELVRSHFGVVSPDARLQRPEYLGGGRSYVSVSSIAQTSASGIAGTTTPLGETAGIGTAMVTRHGFSQSFTEHGIIIGLVSVRADLTYQQGVERMWFRRTQFDFYWPALAHLGEQAIQRKEIYAIGEASDATVFGYQERWSEYKYKPNRVSGEFRSTLTAPLDMWHFAQEFGSAPVLNSTFMQEDPPVDRVLQTDTTFGEQFLMDALFDVRKVRPMPMFSIPGMGPRL